MKADLQTFVIGAAICPRTHRQVRARARTLARALRAAKALLVL